jgi:hypothetical protein
MIQWLDKIKEYIMESTYVGGKGSVRVCKHGSKGLRNKRKSYWNGLRMAEIKEKMKKARAEKRMQRESRDDSY